MKKIEIPENVADILRRSTIADNRITLPGQLSRPDHNAVMKVIAAAGGKWVKKEGAYLFPRAVDLIFGDALKTGEIVHIKKTTQAFYTPDPLAEELVDAAAILPHHHVLEPSAGRGALLKQLWMSGANRHSIPINYEGSTTAVEIDPVSFAFLKTEYPTVKVIEGDFLELYPAAEMGLAFDRVIMNPPFTKGQDVEHVQHAFKFLSRDGWLLAIVSGTCLLNTQKKYREFRIWLEANGEVLKEYKDAEFCSSGTSTSTALIKIVKGGK